VLLQHGGLWERRRGDTYGERRYETNGGMRALRGISGRVQQRKVERQKQREKETVRTDLVKGIIGIEIS